MTVGIDTLFSLLTRSLAQLFGKQRFEQICSLWHTDLRAASKLLHNKIPVATQVSWQNCRCCTARSLYELWQINVTYDKMIKMIITKHFPLHDGRMWCGRQQAGRQRDSWAVRYVLCCFRLTDLITGLYCRKVSIASDGYMKFLYEKTMSERSAKIASCVIKMLGNIPNRLDILYYYIHTKVQINILHTHLDISKYLLFNLIHILSGKYITQYRWTEMNS